MSKAPYMPLAKFDALQAALNSIQHGAIQAAAPKADDATRKEGLDQVLKGVHGLSSELVKLLQEMDKRLYTLER